MAPTVAMGGRPAASDILIRNLHVHLQSMQSTLTLLQAQVETDRYRPTDFLGARFDALASRRSSDLSSSPRTTPRPLSLSPAPSPPGARTGTARGRPVALREEAAAAAVVPPHQSLSELTNLGPKMPHTMVAASDGDLGTSFGSVKSPRTDEDSPVVAKLRPQKSTRISMQQFEEELPEPPMASADSVVAAMPPRRSTLRLELAETWLLAGLTATRSFPSAHSASARFTFDVFARTDFRPFADSLVKSPDRRNVMQGWVMEPTSRTSYFWNLLEMFLLFYDLVMIPLSVFDLPPSPLTDFMVFLAVSFWTLDMPVCCFKGYVTKEGEVEMRFGKVAKHYLKSRAAYDLLLLGIEWLNVTLEQSIYTSSGRFLRFLRFSRLLKVGKMRRLMENFLQRIRSNSALTIISISWVLLLVLAFLHLAACGWYQVCVMAGDPNSWVAHDLVRESSVSSRYAYSAQWAFAVLGFGMVDVLPANIAERGYIVVVSTASIMVLSWLVGNFVILMTRLTALQKTHREQEEQLRDFLCKHNVSWALRNRVWVFLQKSRRKPKNLISENDIELVKHLPKAVVLELRSEVFIPVLTAHPFFCTYAVSQADKFAMHRLVEVHACREVFLQAEHELFSEGEAAVEMYFVVNGLISYQVGDGFGMKPLLASSEELHFNSSHGHPDDPIPMTGNLHSCKSDDPDDSECLCKGQWLCEPALWLEWVHVGWAVARTQSELVTVDAEKFQITMQESLPQARRYARRFLAYAELHREFINDRFADVSSLRSMAQEVFEPPVHFDIRSCVPLVNHSLGRNEWQPSDRRQWQRVWSSAFKDTHLLNRSALLSAMTTEMKHDAVLLFNTMFPSQGHRFRWQSDEDKRLYDQRVVFLKRLVLFLAFGGVQYTTENNAEAVRHWPYPLAAALCHGGRVLVRLNGVPWRHVMSWLFFGDITAWSGDENAPPPPMYTRRAATHGTRLDPVTSKLVEVKVKNTAAFDRCHLGMDLPLGGLGNPAPTGHLDVGPAGVPFKRAKRKGQQPEFMSNIQHGHLYMRWDDFGEKKISSLLSHMSSSTFGTASLPANLSSGVGRPELRSLGSSIASSNVDDSWTTLPQARNETELRAMLESNGVDALADDQAVSLLLQHLSQRSELVIETHSADSKGLRCHGVIMHLVLELVTSENEVKTLVHKSARARPAPRRYPPIGERRGRRSIRDASGEVAHAMRRSFVEVGGDLASFASRRKSQMTDSSSEPAHSARRRMNMFRSASNLSFPADEFMLPTATVHVVEDLRVITIVSRHTETWAEALARFLTESMHLGEAAVAQIVHGCQEDAEEPLVYECEAAPSYCYRHKLAVGDTFPLQYTTLRLRSRIHEEDEVFGDLLKSEFTTMEEGALLGGFDGLPEGTIGSIEREWEWMKLPCEDINVVEGIAPPEGQASVPLRQEQKKVCALLLGIEGSAPLKDDFFGNSHAPDGRSKEISAFGKRKWRDYRKGGQEVPADLGGVRISVNEHRFQQICDVCEHIHLSKPSSNDQGMLVNEERKLFKNLLTSPDNKIVRLLEENFNYSRIGASTYRATSMTP